jgi:D-alanyl-lipoteichoic acid acyltransferase DltB (MBOAT superfamily)
MAVCSLGFLVFCLIVVGLSESIRGARLRQLILACANALFLATLVPDRRSWIFFTIVLAASYAALWLVRLTRWGAVVATSIVLAIVTFLYFKRFPFFATWVPVPFEWNLTQNPVELVGLSYILFKLIHMLVDEWQGQLAPFNIWHYLNYQLAFFTLTAGPIQRYNDFYRSWVDPGAKQPEARDALAFWCRILIGMVKIGVLSGWAQSAFLQAVRPRQYRDLENLALIFYVYPVYLYLNFSGYTDVMVGAGGLLGFKVPENFNHPYLARNVLDFWDRWHISVTHWIRDYVFMTSYKVAAISFPRAAHFCAYLLLFAALFLAGIWHGTAGGFIAFGVLNGLGAAATRIYGDILQRLLGRKGLHKYLQNRAIRSIAVLATFNFVCLSLLFFSCGYDQANLFLSMAWTEITKLPTLLAAHAWQARDFAAVLGVGLLVALLWNVDPIGSKLAGLAAGIARRPALFRSVVCAMTVIVVTVFYLDWAFQQVPPPVRYMAF